MVTVAQPIQGVFALEILNKAEFLNTDPTHVGTVCGIRFYESSNYGDCGTLIAIKDEHCVVSADFEVPHADDLF